MTDEEYTIATMSEDDFIHACWHMPVHGGFAAGIAAAYFVADKDNKRILREAFPDLFIKGFESYARAQRRTYGV